jgi:hypothetical protein
MGFRDRQPDEAAARGLPLARVFGLFSKTKKGKVLLATTKSQSQPTMPGAEETQIEHEDELLEYDESDNEVSSLCAALRCLFPFFLCDPLLNKQTGNQSRGRGGQGREEVSRD